MPNDLLLPIQAGNLPSGFCPASYQDMLNAFSAQQNAVLAQSGSSPVASGFVVSATKPPINPPVAWFQLDTSGNPVRLYYYANGAYLSLHPLVPGSTIWYFNAIADVTTFFNTFDGGDGSSLSTVSGPMWQLAKDANGNTVAAQFPIAAGTLPSTKVLSVPGSGGEENHVLTVPELPNASVALANAQLNMDSTGGQTYTPSGHLAGDVARAGTVVGGNINTQPLGSSTGHNNLPPYVVGYLLQRTLRLYYAVT